MYSITNDCRGFITLVTYKDIQPLDEFERLTKEMSSYVKNKKLFVLSDLRKAKLCLNKNEVYMMEKIDRENRQPGVKVFEAIVCQSPLETAVTTLFNNTKVCANHSVKVFSSEEPAIQWLESYHNYVM